jgi:ribosome recycling factor
MSPNQIVEQAKAKFSAAANHFLEETKKLRTGRAHPSMLDGITVTAYGTPMPLIQVASVSAPEPQLLQITPFDATNLEPISAAIRDNQSLGLNPMDDGRVVRVPIPPLTAERRQQIVKQLHEKVEDSMISLRNIRHDSLKQLDQLKKDKSIGEDDQKRYGQQIDDTMAKTKTDVEAQAKAKEQEITTI